MGEMAASPGNRCASPTGHGTKSLFVVLALLVATSAWGATAPRRPDSASERVIEGWIKELRTIDGDLQGARWRRARDASERLGFQMEQTLRAGGASANLLAMAALYRALGEAGLGKETDAAWDFGIAQNLYRPYAHVDLKPYGVAGELLERHRFTDAVLSLRTRSSLQMLPTPGITPPKRKKSYRIDFPLAKSSACVQDRVVVTFVIGKDGIPTDPMLFGTYDPVLGFSAMNGFRTWRFVAASLGGKPVVASYRMTVNFKPSGCAETTTGDHAGN